MRPTNISKWVAIIESRYKIRNDRILNLMCEYCEWYVANLSNLDLPDRLDEIFTKIDSYKRIDIIGKSYNVFSGNIEYKLSNGDYIPIVGSVSSLPNIEEISDIFGIDFARDQYPQLYREKRIDKIVSD